MHAFALPAFPEGALFRVANEAVARLLRPWQELRVDVQQRPDDIETELESLYERLCTLDDPLYRSRILGALPSGFVFRHREADGEHYLYVEDRVRRRLAGYTVFNRLIEVNRRVDRYVRAPHSKYAPEYQRQGLATAVYEFGLDAGFCLISGARQSPGAHALWHALARRHVLGFVSLREKRLHYLGAEVAEQDRDELETRMILLGKGWTLERLHRIAGAELAGR